MSTNVNFLSGNVINGGSIAKSIRERVAYHLKSLKAVSPIFQPCLAVIQTGERQDSTVYVRMKAKAAEEIGFKFRHIALPVHVSASAVVDIVRKLNDDADVNGILVQFPLGDHVTSEEEKFVTESISPQKDVDGFHVYNIGNLASRESVPFFSPCTPSAVIRLLEATGVSIAGSNAVVIGRSDIVGNPVTAMLRRRDATVTQCHSKTRNVESIVKNADIVVAAVGKPELVRGSWIKPGAVVIDVGINHVPDSTKKSGYRLVGDVEFTSCSENAAYITPVPGGVGPMTVAILMENTLQSAERFWLDQRKQKFKSLPISPLRDVPSDLEISRAQEPKSITQLAEEIGLRQDELETCGKYKGKVGLGVLERLAHRKNGKYVIISGITPSHLGEGKSTTAIGLAQALEAELERPAFACIRQPSQRSTVGIVGSAVGGGYSQVIPRDEFILLTSDIEAISAAINLTAAALDSRIFYEATQTEKAFYGQLAPTRNGKRVFPPLMLKRLKKLGISKINPDDLTEEEINRFVRLDIDLDSISWNRAIDINDQFLPKINKYEQEPERETGFETSVASECMAVLSLCTNLEDMVARLGQIVVATSKGGDPITADDLGVSGALAVLMKDSLKPNLMQTLQGTPVFVHADPFANVAHGNSSVLADKIALKLAGSEEGDSPGRGLGYVLTEGGFGGDISVENFCNIKCRASGVSPDATVIVATTRTLKMHGGVTPGKVLHDTNTSKDLVCLKEGCQNLIRHIQNCRKFGVKVIVGINRFASDTPAELQLIQQEALAGGADAAVVSDHWAKGGAGAVELANALVVACEGLSSHFKFLYDLDLPIEQKITVISKEIYGAGGIKLSKLAMNQIDTYSRKGYAKFPVCMPKTQYSISHYSELKNVPKGFIVPVLAIRLFVGAGFLYPILGDSLKRARP